MLYSEKQGDTLNHLCYLTYMHLIVQWKSLMATYLDPENWGWKLKGGMYMPVPTDLKAAPPDILNVISCKCHSSTGNC